MKTAGPPLRYADTCFFRFVEFSALLPPGHADAHVEAGAKGTIHPQRIGRHSDGLMMQDVEPSAPRLAARQFRNPVSRC